MELRPSEMIAENLKQLHGTSANITGARLLVWYNLEQDYVEKLRQDWLFCIDRDNTISATSADDDYDLPTDFDHFLALWNNTDDKQMYEKSLNWLRKYDPDLSSSGSPDWYVMLGPTGTDNVQQVRLVDSPDDDYTIGYDYYKKLPKLTNKGTDTPSLIPCSELLMIRAEIRGRIDNEEAEDGSVVQYLEGRYRTLLQTLIKHNTLRPNKFKRMLVDYRCTFDYWKYQ